VYDVGNTRDKEGITMTNKKLEINNLHISVKDTEIVKGVSLTIEQGKTIAIMGPNGSGKSTLVNAVMGNPTYTITNGTITLDGEDITELTPDKRAKLGLFLSMQYPSEIEGVTIANFLRTALKEAGNDLPIPEFMALLKQNMNKLKIDNKFAQRYLNHGFSGGEKKRSEILQLSMLKPSIALLDETDSGLDVDALKIVAEGVNQLTKDTNMGILLVTHYQRLLNHIKPDIVHIMRDGKIIKTGDASLALHIEDQGYEQLEVTNE
jgi:Fe-S cluster assembly ATP-binding protein